MRLILILGILFSNSIFAENKKIICELSGSYSITYKDIKKTYLSEGIEFFKNLAQQTQQSLFLLQRAKTSFAQEDWQKDNIYIVQYWEIDDQDNLVSMKHTFEPSPIWLNPQATWSSEKSDLGMSVFHTMQNGEIHPMFKNYNVDIYRVTNSFNWYTGKGKLEGDIWLKTETNSKNKNPKVEIRAKGSCEAQKRKF